MSRGLGDVYKRQVGESHKSSLEQLKLSLENLGNCPEPWRLSEFTKAGGINSKYPLFVWISSMKLMNDNLFLFSERSELIEISLQKKKIKNIFNSKYDFKNEIIVIKNHLYFVDKKKLIKLS